VRTTLIGSAVGLMISLFWGVAYSQSSPTFVYPKKTVRIVLGTEPGGGADIQARVFAQQLTQSMNVQFIVDNRPGAAQEIAHVFVAKSPPDGATILLASPAFTFLPAITGRTTYDPIKQYVPVIALSQSPYVFYVNPQLPVTTLKDYIAYARANPEKLNIGIVGPGGFTHLAAAWMHSAADVKVVYVPYKGTGPILGEVGSGRLHGAFGNPLSVLPQVKAGRLKLLAVSTGKRARALPDLPTVAEQAVPGYELSTWQAILVPAGTAPQIVTALNREFDSVLKTPEMISKLQEDGSEPVGGAPETLRQLISNEVKRWGDLVPSLGLRQQ